MGPRDDAPRTQSTITLYIDVINVYNVYKKFFVNAFII